jgi:hypothetical protein
MRMIPQLVLTVFSHQTLSILPFECWPTKTLTNQKVKIYKHLIMQLYSLFTLLFFPLLIHATTLYRTGNASKAVNAIRPQDFGDAVNGELQPDPHNGYVYCLRDEAILCLLSVFGSLSTFTKRCNLPGGGAKNCYAYVYLL